MKPLTCSAARRRLQAFHDGELVVADQIAVGAHVAWCEACAAMLAELRLVGAALRIGSTWRDRLSPDEAVTLAAHVTSRRKAEQDAAFFSRVRRMFDDMHFVYAGVGAAAATIVCVAIMWGMMRFATDERPDSLAAIVDLMATPGSSANTIAIDAASHLRGTARFQAASEDAEQDAVFALAAIVTRDGRLANFARLKTNTGKAVRDEMRLVEGLMDAVTRARMGPGTRGGTGTAANSMVWLVTRTTVRATKILGMDLPLPPAAKKRMTRLDRPLSAAGALTTRL